MRKSEGTALNGRAEENILRWFGHMEQMPEERIVKRIYKSEVEGVRARGRPWTRWVE
jgi:hypothetical protein